MQCFGSVYKTSISVPPRILPEEVDYCTQENIASTCTIPICYKSGAQKLDFYWIKFRVLLIPEIKDQMFCIKRHDEWIRILKQEVEACCAFIKSLYVEELTSPNFKVSLWTRKLKILRYCFHLLLQIVGVRRPFPEFVKVFLKHPLSVSPPMYKNTLLLE